MEELKCCPKCDCTTYYIKMNVKGRIHTYFNFDGTVSDYTDAVDGLSRLNHEISSKFAFCAECDKRLFKIHEDRSCRVCGCTEYNACAGGCYWIDDGLCSKCGDK